MLAHLICCCAKSGSKVSHRHSALMLQHIEHHMYGTAFKYRRYLSVVALATTVGNNTLHCVSAVMTVVITVLRK